jgi:hypothetical protein
MCRGEDSASEQESEHSYDSWRRIEEASQTWERDKREQKAAKKKAKREKQRLQAEKASGSKPPQASGSKPPQEPLPTSNPYKLLEPRGGPKMTYADFLRLNSQSSTRPAPSRDPSLDENPLSPVPSKEHVTLSVQRPKT